MENATYVVSVEDPDGQRIAGATFSDENEARREAEGFLGDPAYVGCTVWFTDPSGNTQALGSD